MDALGKRKCNIHYFSFLKRVERLTVGETTEKRRYTAWNKTTISTEWKLYLPLWYHQRHRILRLTSSSTKSALKTKKSHSLLACFEHKISEKLTIHHEESSDVTNMRSALFSSVEGKRFPGEAVCSVSGYCPDPVSQQTSIFRSKESPARIIFPGRNLQWLFPSRVYLPSVTPKAWLSRLRIENCDLTPTHACVPISHA